MNFSNEQMTEWLSEVPEATSVRCVAIPPYISKEMKERPVIPWDLLTREVNNKIGDGDRVLGIRAAGANSYGNYWIIIWVGNKE